jgi:2-methylcitrate dehydratase PrpD
MSLNFERLVSRVKKAANPAIKRDYPPEAGVELRGKEGEHSYAPASKEGEDGNRVNTSKVCNRNRNPHY